MLLLTVEIVHLEEEDHLFVGALAGELLHGLDELRLGHGAAAVAVKDPESSLNKEFLKIEIDELLNLHTKLKSSKMKSEQFLVSRPQMAVLQKAIVTESRAVASGLLKKSTNQPRKKTKKPMRERLIMYKAGHTTK